MRAYTVASFFTALLVLVILNIHEGIFENKTIKKKDLVYLILVYGIGYISHYTVGAVLVSFGFVMLVFMLVSHKKGIVQIIVAGALGLLFGICLSPDSVIGVLRKFMVNGAGAADTEETVSPLIILLIVIVVVCLVVLGLSISRKRELTGSKLVYVTTSALIMLLIILLGTKGYGYTRVLYPIMFLLLLRWIFELGSAMEKRMSERILKAIGVAVLIAYIFINLSGAYLTKQDENADFLAKQTALDEQQAETCIFFRKHAQGYADTRCLIDRFKEVQVVTLDTEDWEKMVEYKFDGEPVVCFFADDCENDEALAWLKGLGYEKSREIYADDATHIFLAAYK